MSEIPRFVYHPDPVRTGSIIESDDECERCGMARGWMYSGPIYAVDEIEFVCPWCIADGSGASEFDAEFTTTDGSPSEVPGHVLDEIVHRTPGFEGWQQERWLFHCGDGAEFYGRAGWAEVSASPGAVESLRTDGWPEDVLPSLRPDGDLTAYLFRCRHCGQFLAYADSS